MRKLYVYVAEDRQLQASNRDPSVATPDRTVGTRPQVAGSRAQKVARHRMALEVIERCRPGAPRIRASYPAMRVPALCECLHCASVCTMSIAAPMLSRAVGFCGVLGGSHYNGGFVEGEDA